MEQQTGGAYIGNGVHTFVFGYSKQPAVDGWSYLPMQVLYGGGDTETFVTAMKTRDLGELRKWVASLPVIGGVARFPFQSPNLGLAAVLREPVARVVFAGDGELEVHRAVKSICLDIPMARMHTNTFLAVYETHPYFLSGGKAVEEAIFRQLLTTSGLLGNANYDAIVKSLRYEQFRQRPEKEEEFNDWLDYERGLYATSEEKKMRVFLARTQGPDVSKMSNELDDGNGGSPALDKLHVLACILRTLQRVNGRWVHCDLHSGNAACLRNGVGVIHDFGMARMLRYLDDRARGVTIPKQNNKYMFHTFVRKMSRDLGGYIHLNQYRDVVLLLEDYRHARNMSKDYYSKLEKKVGENRKAQRKAYAALVNRRLTLRNARPPTQRERELEQENEKRYREIYFQYSQSYEVSVAWFEHFARTPTSVPFENRRMLVYPALLPPEAPTPAKERNVQMRQVIEDLVSLGKCYSITGNEYSIFSDEYGPNSNSGMGRFIWGPELKVKDGDTVYLDPAFETRLHQLARVFDSFSIMRNIAKLWNVPDGAIGNTVSIIVQSLKDAVLVGRASQLFVTTRFDEAIKATYAHLGVLAWNPKTIEQEDADAVQYWQTTSWNPALKWGRDQEAEARAELAAPIGFVAAVEEFKNRYDPATLVITEAGKAAEAAEDAAQEAAQEILRAAQLGQAPAAPAVPAALVTSAGWFGVGPRPAHLPQPPVSDLSSPESGVTYEVGPDGVRGPVRALQAERLNDPPAVGPVINNPEDISEVSAILAEVASVSAQRLPGGRLAAVDDAFDDAQYSMPRSGREKEDEEDELDNADIGVDGRIILPEHLELLRQAVAVAAPEDVPPPPVAPLGAAAAAAAAAAAEPAAAAAEPLPLPPPGDIELLLPRGVQRERSPERPAAPNVVVPSPNERPRSRSRGPAEEGGRRRKRKVTRRNKKNVT